jgi:hypothetical protein
MPVLRRVSMMQDRHSCFETRFHVDTPKSQAISVAGNEPRRRRNYRRKESATPLI